MTQSRAEKSPMSLRRQPIRPPTRLRCALAMAGLLIGVALAALPIFADGAPCVAIDDADTAQLFVARNATRYPLACR